jgi:hypothetical protein
MLRASSLALAAALAVSSMASPPGETQALAEANRRWRGARCRTRQEITVRKKADGDGWSKSEWLWYGGKKGGNERVLVLFTNSAAIHARYPGGTLPPGVDLVGVGWATEKPDGAGDLYLELEHPGVGARARVYYYADWVGRVPLSRLAEFERWARLELFEMLSTPEESLEAVAAPPPIAVPSTARGGASQGSPVAQAPGALELRVLAASVEPARVLAGAEVGLQVVYSVAGLASGGEADVSEQRVVRRDGAMLTTLEARARRAAGVHQSTQKLRLPGDLAPGVYELEARVASGGREATGSAVFQVTAQGGR